MPDQNPIDLVHWLDDNGKHELGRVVRAGGVDVQDVEYGFTDGDVVAVTSLLVQPLNAPCGHAVWVERSRLTPYTGAKGTEYA